MSRRKRKSRRWADEQSRDPYARQARQHGYRSRAFFKLAEIEKQRHLFQSCRYLLDLGASPGGWSQYASKCLSAGAVIVAVDILQMKDIPGVEIIQGDFMEEHIQKDIKSVPPDGRYDLVISDISPNITGIADVDQRRSADLVIEVIRFSFGVLRNDGRLLVKVFAGGEMDNIRRFAANHFRECEVLKPRASKDRSREHYLLLKTPCIDDP